MILKKMERSIKKLRCHDEEQRQHKQIEFALALEETLTLLEAGVHESDDPERIIQSAMQCACKFYDGDWVGFLEVDMELALWAPTAWYNLSANDNTRNLLNEFESSEFLHRWVKAMDDNTPIIIDDVNIVKEEFPDEFEILKRLNVQTILAVPVKPRPTGFLVVRNPKRYGGHSNMLQMLAFVVLACINEKNLLKSRKMSYSPDSITHETDVQINLLGEFEIYTSCGVLRYSDLNSPMICKLLAYMLLNRKKIIPPQELLEALWPEEQGDSDKSLQKLRTLILRVRRSFGLISEHSLIETMTNGYCLNRALHIKTDLQFMDRLWKEVKETNSTYSRVNFLKQAMELYRGPVLGGTCDEIWLLPTVTACQMHYTAMTNELLRILAEAKDYHGLYEYAGKSIEVNPGNEKAYYWMTYATIQMGAHEVARHEIEAAKRHLTEEEYVELCAELRRIPIGDQTVHFRNEKLEQLK